jgi:DNA mismatch repair ATPase MutS
MKVNLKAPLLSIKGEPMKEQELDAKGNVISSKETEVKELLLRALTITTKKDEERSTKEKYFALAVKILQHKEDVIDLESDEVARIKEKCAEVFDIWAMGQLFLILEGKPLEI